MPYPGLIEVWTREQLLFIAELPGLQVSAATTTELFRKLPLALSNHEFWLRRQGIGERLRDDTAEVVEKIAADAERGMPYFQADVAPPGEALIALAQQIAERSRQDLIAIFRRNRTASVTTQAFGKLTVPALLREVARLDTWYSSVFAADPEADATVPLSRDPVEALEQADALFQQRLRELAPERHGEVWAAHGELWTLAKIVRRRTGHYREHFPELAPLAL